jgi:hypothetical protein
MYRNSSRFAPKNSKNDDFDNRSCQKGRLNGQRPIPFASMPSTSSERTAVLDGGKIVLLRLAIYLVVKSPTPQSKIAGGPDGDMPLAVSPPLVPDPSALAPHTTAHS